VHPDSPLSHPLEGESPHPMAKRRRPAIEAASFPNVPPRRSRTADRRKASRQHPALREITDPARRSDDFQYSLTLPDIHALLDASASQPSTPPPLYRGRSNDGVTSGAVGRSARNSGFQVLLDILKRDIVDTDTPALLVTEQVFLLTDPPPQTGPGRMSEKADRPAGRGSEALVLRRGVRTKHSWLDRADRSDRSATGRGRPGRPPVRAGRSHDMVPSFPAEFPTQG
jgi:hypothetical protein